MNLDLINRNFCVIN